MKHFLTGLLLLTLATSAAIAQPNNAEAKKFLEEKRFADALGPLRVTVQLYPRDAESWLLLSKAYLGNNQADSAELAGRKSLQYEDEDPVTYAVLSDALIRQKKYAEANTILRDGLKERKNHPALLLQLARLQLSMDSLDAALKTFTMTREFDPTNPKAYEGMGDVYSLQGVSPMAVGQYEKSIELDSSQLGIMRKIVDIHLKDRQWNDAVRWLQIWISRDPGNPKAQFQLGEIYYRTKVLWSRAFNTFRPYVARYPKDTAAVRMFVESAYMSRQWKDVSDWADKALALDPSFTRAYLMKAHALYYQKMYAPAIEAFASVVAKDSMEAEDYAKLGRSHYELEQLEQAVAAYEKAVSLDSTLTSTMNDAGTIYMRLRQYKEAARMFEMRYTHDTSSAAVTAYINYAQCQLVLEDFAKAATALRIAIERAPDYVPSYTRLGIAYLQMKDYPSARKTFEQVIQVADTGVTKYRDDLFSANKYIGLTLMIDGSKRWGDAVKWLRKALEYIPNDENGLLLLAQALQNDNKIDDALKYYIAVLKVNPKNEQALEGKKTLENIKKDE